MGLVVQKYGGSSVADATSIKRVAQRIVETKKAGHDVCVVVSAMGDTTDELIDLAEQVSPLPPGRELDMLLTAGERIAMSLLAMAIHDLGVEARSFTGSQAGVITDVRPRQCANHRRHTWSHPRRHGRERRRDRRRLPGRQSRTPRTSRRWAGVAPTPRPSRWRPRCQRRGVRDLHGRRRRVHRGPAHRPARLVVSRTSPTRRCSSSPPVAPRSCTCAVSSTRGDSTCPSMSARRSVTETARGSSRTTRQSLTPRRRCGRPDHLRRRTRPQRGQGDGRSGCRTSPVRPP